MFACLSHYTGSSLVLANLYFLIFVALVLSIQQGAYTLKNFTKDSTLPHRCSMTMIRLNDGGGHWESTEENPINQNIFASRKSFLYSERLYKLPIIVIEFEILSLLG